MALMRDVCCERPRAANSAYSATFTIISTTMFDCRLSSRHGDVSMRAIESHSCKMCSKLMAPAPLPPANPMSARSRAFRTYRTAAYCKSRSALPSCANDDTRNIVSMFQPLSSNCNPTVASCTKRARPRGSGRSTVSPSVLYAPPPFARLPWTPIADASAGISRIDDDKSNTSIAAVKISNPTSLARASRCSCIARHVLNTSPSDALT
mmetsp:Transcript_11319/g.24368  ORF Transcript_11319/g.24368 Transcript_11319/m.24368 type:complete len:208 (+) Transcript_11319:797-1420(+)